MSCSLVVAVGEASVALVLASAVSCALVALSVLLAGVLLALLATELCCFEFSDPHPASNKLLNAMTDTACHLNVFMESSLRSISD